MKAEFQQLRRRLLFPSVLAALLFLILGFLLSYASGLSWYLFVGLCVAVLGLLVWMERLLLDRSLLGLVRIIGDFGAQLTPARASLGTARKLGEALEMLEANLRHLAQEADQARRTNRAFVADVSHQLSQPLTALRGTLELALRKRSRPSEYRATMEEALEQADRIVQLARALRELAESEHPGEPSEKAFLSSLVREVTDDLHPLAEEHGLSLALECESDLYVSANSVRLQQAVLNLVGNAINRSPKGGKVQVSLSRSDRHACLSILDEGPTIPPSELDHLFEPFPRIASKSRDDGASSVGLAIAKRVVEIVGGTIEVESKVGQKSCFRIRLPLATA